MTWKKECIRDNINEKSIYSKKICIYQKNIYMKELYKEKDIIIYNYI